MFVLWNNRERLPALPAREHLLSELREYENDREGGTRFAGSLAGCPGPDLHADGERFRRTRQECRPDVRRPVPRLSVNLKSDMEAPQSTACPNLYAIEPTGRHWSY